MKLKELLAIMRSVRDENTTFTLVDYDIYGYLDGSEKDTVCSFSSDLKSECFLKDSILEAEVIAMGMKSEIEMVFELSNDWNNEKEEPEVVDVRCPSKTLDVSVTKNEFGFFDVTIRDLEEDDMIEMLNKEFDLLNIYPTIRDIKYQDILSTEHALEYERRMLEYVRTKIH